MRKQGTTTIGKIMRGTNEISKIYHGTNLVYENIPDITKKPDILLECISNGSDGETSVKDVYFDTNVVCDASTRIELVCSPKNVSSSTAVPALAVVNGSSQGLAINVPGSGNKINAIIGTQVVTGPTPTSNTKYTIVTYQSSSTQAHMFVNGTQYNVTTTSTFGAGNAYLFGRNINGAAVAKAISGLKIYYVKIWKNDNLVRFYIPVMHWVGGKYVACFYDKVNDNYIYNKGNDDLKYISTNYYMLDYISNGVSPISTSDGIKVNLSYDTGVAASRDINIDTSFVYGNTKVSGAEQEAYILAIRNASATKYGIMTDASSTHYLKVPGWNMTAFSPTPDTKYQLSVNYDSSTTYKRKVHINDLLFQNTTNANNVSLGMNHFIGSDASSGTGRNIWAGTKIYYASYSNKNNTPNKSFIPVLVGENPVFYNLNDNTYVTNAANVDASYGYLSGYDDVLLKYIANGPDTDASTKQVYFDTGYVPTTSTRIEVSSAATASVSVALSNNNTAIFTNYGATASRHQCLPNFGTVYDYIQTEKSIGQQYALSMLYSPNNVIFAVDGSIHTISVNGAPQMGSDSLYLFAINYGGTAMFGSSYSGQKIYYLKIWENNNLVRFYIPVLHYIDGQYVACFYDKVNGNYIYNLGTDTVSYKRTKDYLLDWLGAPDDDKIPTTKTYALRYDTGVVPSINVYTDIKFRAMIGQENHIMASTTDNTTSPTWLTYGIGCLANNMLRINGGAASGSNKYITYAAADASVDATKVNRVSMYFNEDNWLYAWVNDTSYNVNSSSSVFPPNTLHLFDRHGNSQNLLPLRGSRIYYCVLTNSYNPAKTIVPVLHNGNAVFLDLQTGKYIDNMLTGTPYYELT